MRRAREEREEPAGKGGSGAAPSGIRGSPGIQRGSAARPRTPARRARTQRRSTRARLGMGTLRGQKMRRRRRRARGGWACLSQAALSLHLGGQFEAIFHPLPGEKKQVKTLVGNQHYFWGCIQTSVTCGGTVKSIGLGLVHFGFDSTAAAFGAALDLVAGAVLDCTEVFDTPRDEVEIPADCLETCFLGSSALRSPIFPVLQSPLRNIT